MKFCSFILLISLGFSSSTLFCPDRHEISPCTCVHDTSNENNYIYCDDAKSESDIEDAFLVPFPIKDLYQFIFNINEDIRELTHYLFNGATFLYITIQANDLVKINETFFEGQGETLLEIEANDNRLGNEGFPYSALSSLPYVSYLRLDGNGISSLPVPIPSNNVKHLDYNYNVINTIEEGTFQNCKELVTLDLYFNAFQSLSPGKNNFLYVNFFIKIKLSFISGAFSGADSLKTINLYRNDLTRILEGTFDNLLSLTDISLYKNPVHTLEIGM